MYACMYSCLLSNQNVQSQLSEINARVATSENNASRALSLATNNQDEVARLREEVTDLRAAPANSTQSNTTSWGSALIVSGIPSSAGTNYESLVISIFKTIGAERFVTDISSVTLRPTKRTKIAVAATSNNNSASTAVDADNENNATGNSTSAATTQQETMISLLVRLKSPTIRYDIIQLKVAPIVAFFLLKMSFQLSLYDNTTKSF